MTILNYNIVNLVTDNKMPFFDERKGIFYIPNFKRYKYYVEAINVNQTTGIKEYYILFGNTRFIDGCRTSKNDGYRRTCIKVFGEMKDFISEECKDKGNVSVIYVESFDDYDVWRVC